MIIVIIIIIIIFVIIIIIISIIIIIIAVIFVLLTLEVLTPCLPFQKNLSLINSYTKPNLLLKRERGVRLFVGVFSR